MKALSATEQMKAEEGTERVQRAMAAQDYDPAAPRCATCVYFKHEPLVRLVERTLDSRHGKKTRKVMVRLRPHPTRNPMVDRCTFGNFLVKPAGVCNEWHSRSGERIALEPAS